MSFWVPLAACPLKLSSIIDLEDQEEEKRPPVNHLLLVSHLTAPCFLCSDLVRDISLKSELKLQSQDCTGTESHPGISVCSNAQEWSFTVMENKKKMSTSFSL